MAGTLHVLCLSGFHADDSPGITGIPYTGLGTECELGVGIVCGLLILAIASVSSDCCSYGPLADCVSTSSSMAHPNMIVASETSLSLGRLITMGLNRMENR